MCDYNDATTQLYQNNNISSSYDIRLKKFLIRQQAHIKLWDYKQKKLKYSGDKDDIIRKFYSDIFNNKMSKSKEVATSKR